MTEPLAQSRHPNRLLKDVLLAGVEFGVHCLALTAFVLFNLKCVPAAKQMFDHFDVHLPALTQLVVTVATIVAVYWYLLVPLVLADGLLLLGLRRSPSWLRWFHGCWFSGWLLTLVLYLFFASAGLAISTDHLMADLQ